MVLFPACRQAGNWLAFSVDRSLGVGGFFPPVPNGTFGRGLLFFATKKSDKRKSTIRRKLNQREHFS
jgi:hypothetical protein